MSRFIRTISWLLLLVTSTGTLAEEQQASAEPEALTIDALVESVRNSSERKQALMKEREARFLATRDNQAELLEETRRKRLAAEREADRLAEAFEQGEEELANLETELATRTGDLEDVFAVIRQVASDAMPMLESSLVSSELGDRTPLLSSLSSNIEMPTSEDMRDLWLLLLEEMNASGKVNTFDGLVISSDGEEIERQVTRIGSFTAVSDGEYLRYLPESGRLLSLARQPADADPASTRAFERAEEPLMTIPIDPSRGSILALVVQRAGLGERIEQGGLIGYFILLIGLVGVVLGVERIAVVYLADRRQRSELVMNDGSGTGPIAQLQRIAVDNEFNTSVDALSAKMDEIITTANQQLNRGLPTIAIFAAVSPLLGLLGTVTGMIETFQVITLFGAGDPRLMSGGISQALITTQLGLAVAIPLLLIHSFLQGRVNTQVAVLDETAADLFAHEQARS